MVRLLRGRHGYWCLANSKAALLSADAVDDKGSLQPATKEQLEDQGFFVEEVDNTYYLTILTSTACNLGCAYCFQNTGMDESGGFSPPRIARKVLTSATIDNILSFADKGRARRHAKWLDLLLFGGEPLLNGQACVELLGRAQSHGLSNAAMISNGVLLTADVAQELEAVGLRRVQITFDGHRQQHDGVRVTHGGHRTFDQIVANIEKASAVTRLRWNLRINVTRGNMAAIEDLVLLLAQRVDTSRTTVNFAPVEDVGIGYDSTLAYDDDLVDMFVSWNTLALAKGFSVPFYKPLRACTYCSELGGRSGAVINADGTLYSCWESVGKPGYEVGDVIAGYLPDDVIKPRWVACNYDVIDKGSTVDVNRFADKIDTARLDWLYEHGVSLAGTAR